MVTRKEDLKMTVKENVQNGPGSGEFTRLVNQYQLYEEARLFNLIKLPSGSGIGEHTHEGECEVYYVLKGVGTYNDNGVMTTLYPGDVAYCPSGEMHAITNNGDEDFEFIALIVVDIKAQ